MARSEVTIGFARGFGGCFGVLFAVVVCVFAMTFYVVESADQAERSEIRRRTEEKARQFRAQEAAEKAARHVPPDESPSK